MSVRELRSEPLTGSLTLRVVDVHDPRRPDDSHTVYEVQCAGCDGVDQFDTLSGAQTYGPQHRCPVSIAHRVETATIQGKHRTWPAIVLTFADGTTLRAHHRPSSGRWTIDAGDGWAHVLELETAELAEPLDHGPATYGHITHYLTAAALERAGVLQ